MMQLLIIMKKTKFNNLILTVSNFVLFIQYHFQLMLMLLQMVDCKINKIILFNYIDDLQKSSIKNIPNIF